MKKKIYDCSTFFKGNLLFETRLRTLESFVDYFIVCEATKTHTGKEKNLNFNYEKFKKSHKRNNGPLDSITLDKIARHFKTGFGMADYW